MAFVEVFTDDFNRASTQTTLGGIGINSTSVDNWYTMSNNDPLLITDGQIRAWQPSQLTQRASYYSGIEADTFYADRTTTEIRIRIEITGYPQTDEYFAILGGIKDDPNVPAEYGQQYELRLTMDGPSLFYRHAFSDATGGEFLMNTDTGVPINVGDWWELVLFPTGIKVNRYLSKEANPISIYEGTNTDISSGACGLKQVQTGQGGLAAVDNFEITAKEQDTSVFMTGFLGQTQFNASHFYITGRSMQSVSQAKLTYKGVDTPLTILNKNFNVIQCEMPDIFDTNMKLNTPGVDIACTVTGASASPDGYQVEWHDGDLNWQSSGDIPGGTADFFEADELKPSTTYTLRTRAYTDNPRVFGPYSAEFELTTTGAAPPPPSGIRTTNEPSGLSQITSRTFAGRGEDGWIDNSGTGWSNPIVSGALSDRVGRITYFEGARGGYLSDGARSSYNTLNHGEIYLSCRMRHSGNWQGHQSAVNKIFYFGDNSQGNYGAPLYYNYYTGSAYGPSPCMEMRTQGAPDPYNTTNFGPNRTHVHTPPGPWYEIEYHTWMNSAPGVHDAGFRIWVDGVLTIEHTNLIFSNGDRRFNTIRWEPIWGGTGDTVRVSSMYTDMDYIYISGR